MHVGWIIVLIITIIEVTLFCFVPDFRHPFSVASAGIAAIAATFLARFVQLVESGDPPSIQRHWGGVGGGVSGWRMSISIVYLGGAMFFAMLATAVAAIDTLESRGPVTASTSATASGANATGSPADSTKGTGVKTNP